MAAVAIFCLQINYIRDSYIDYVEKESLKLDDLLHLTINYEYQKRVFDRREQRTGEKSKESTLKGMSEMTREELDSLLDIMPLPKLPTETMSYDVKDLIKKGVLNSSGDLPIQKNQDGFFDEGLRLNMTDLDSIFIAELGEKLPHQLRLYDKDMSVIEASGDQSIKKPNYTSQLNHIGLKGRLFVELVADIPLSSFLLSSIVTLLLSASLIIIIILTLAFQLIVIRDKGITLKSQQQAIYGIIHDLKSPLVSIQAMLKFYFLKQTDLDEKEKIDSDHKRVMNIISNVDTLLSVAKMSNSKLTMSWSTLSPEGLVTMVESVRGDLSVSYSSKRHTVEIENKLESGVSVTLDKMYIESVMRNLIENAIKYSDEGVNIVVTIDRDRDNLLVSVVDNGWGIAKRDQSRLFRQFSQVPREGIVNKGYGIGLAHTKSIITAHKGKISVESEENVGSTFKFSLPLSQTQ